MQTSGNFKDDGTITAAGRGAVCIPTDSRNQQFRKLKALRENQICFDCPNTRPTWASVTYGVSVELAFLASFSGQPGYPYTFLHFCRCSSLSGLLCTT